MTKLLIFTTGQTDVQVVANNERHELERHELEGKNCGLLHDEIKKREWEVVDAPNLKARVRMTALPPDSPLQLCTPKLDAVLCYFGSKLPSAALIFDTRRKMNSDPRFAGEVVKKRLNDRGVSNVTCCTFLEDCERLEDSTADPEDAVVRRDIVKCLSEAIKDAVTHHKPEKIVVATTGGLAAANDVIKELARLYAVSNNATAIVLEVPDAALANQADRAVEEKFHPDAGYRARWQALLLIQKGNLLGAWGAVEHISGTSGQEWTQVVRCLADFASSQPIDCDLPGLKHKRMAVRAALRVELALRAGDIPRAVHGTMAFFESDLKDWLRDRDFTKDDGASGDIQAGFTFTEAPTGEKGKRFRLITRDGKQVYKIDDFSASAQEAWVHKLGKTKLTALERAISTNKIRYLRNDVAHNEPTTELMESATSTMQQAELWSEDVPPKFLSQPLVQGVLTELGVSNPNQLCEDLLKEVRERLLA